ncbi:alpha-D-ribose 1-methylphosphonate 5-triphosphate diphosphatase [Parasulfitobacter algicola]|uniref:Alpha-D-ribose 1-methylphosphonate 5-triphosphate diphosphatase n=1 Tax=Parasulfitobacter algicola TaxID=2614809 RepID=A0ABX2IKT8_9RHOB|nr:alpha-D-ribose 1-methylphosphonate 5-triphosphate diphosphatase [Sulfitobacter algicola]NSX53477.1 alpha-D-ribose 1-methylphosphonate 5-triphosphate diphosphatase [Sulfitobacter algicola]
MTHDLILANATLVLPTETVKGSLTVRNGIITSIDTGHTVPSDAIDCQGDYVAPGLIELHTDNLERHINPRPKVDWPHQAAILAHDGELASTGITTVFDAIRVGSIVSNQTARYRKYARQMANEILAMRDAGALKISHHLHLRAEICSETLIDELAEFGPQDRIGIISLMDHTPGQRQFSDLSKFEDYVCGKHGLSKNDFDIYVQQLYDIHSELGAKHEAAAVEAANRLGATLASHDDTTAEQVGVSKTHGITVAEFPTTVVAAQACKASDIGIIMGAPNLVRGGSHSGNVAAADLAQIDHLDILSSDYVPASLLLGAVHLGNLWGNMARGVSTVTSAPAQAAHLDDRGSLRSGARADIIRFSTLHKIPAVRGVWSNGLRVG